ncbi:MAG: hypothetical protein ACFCUE_04790 [Candidatus Bathyarchaeia archaeon]
MVATENALFICPQCGKPTLAIHRKTYDETAIIFCTDCRLNTDFTPSKTAYFDAQLTYKEFIAEYKRTIKTQTC